ncbi:hypothetical protein TIFTF001_021782 [Ficus carica]|uniref:Uncharacterized protein n=1 Tax=Ficus carica TaxID=3494 RepID=A0AA88AGJ6_FICCA|nr:hypothetical protein TIFTF001_021782 [Ficus carica]
MAIPSAAVRTAPASCPLRRSAMRVADDAHRRDVRDARGEVGFAGQWPYGGLATHGLQRPRDRLRPPPQVPPPGDLNRRPLDIR